MIPSNYNLINGLPLCQESNRINFFEIKYITQFILLYIYLCNFTS